MRGVAMAGLVRWAARLRDVLHEVFARVAPRGTRRRVALRVLGYTLFACAGGAAVVAVHIATFSNVSTDFELRVDGAVVLGAAVYGTKPSPVLEGRLEHALELWRMGRVQKALIVTGGGRAGQRWSEAEVSAIWLAQRGVPKERILLEARSHTTRENLCFLAPIAAAHGIRSLALVTDPLHMARAVHIANDLGLQVLPAATPHTRFRSVRARAMFVARETYLFIGMLMVGPSRCD